MHYLWLWLIFYVWIAQSHDLPIVILTYLLNLDRTIARLTYCNSDLSFKFRSHNRTTYNTILTYLLRLDLWLWLIFYVWIAQSHDLPIVILTYLLRLDRTITRLITQSQDLPIVILYVMYVWIMRLSHNRMTYLL